MSTFKFRCPRCGECRIITPNTGFTCKKCKIRYSIGPNGEIRKAFPKK